MERPADEDVFILRCEGRIAVGEEGGVLRARVLDLLASATKIVVDLKQVNYIDSAGIGILTGLFTSAKRRGGELKLLSPSQPTKDVLHRTRLDTIFSVYEEEAEALAAFPNQFE